ncbi:glycosyltransferase [Nanoarchaeota archaeon]
MISIVIPAYNEEGNLKSLVMDLDKLRKKEKWDCEIVISNDNSSDKTPKIAEDLKKKLKKIKVVQRKKGNNGMGFALMEGTEKASGDIMVWVMGDESDDLTSIPKMVAKIKKGDDMVFGSRYMEGGDSGNLAKFKAFLSSGYTLACRLLFGIKVHDITNAYRAFRKEVYDNVPLVNGDFAISPEFAIKAQLRGYKLGEVPTGYTDRQAGQSQFKIIKMGLSYSKLFIYRFKKF